MSIPRRILGPTGLSVSEIGFGAWQLGADWGDAVPEEQALEALQSGVAAGMNLIDTADIYGAGRSELLIGKFLRQHRGEPVHVITKMGRGPNWSDDTQGVRRAAEASCERLGISSLDLVQLHCLDEALVKSGRVLDSLERIKGEGLIRHYGLSVETIEHGLWAISNTGAATLQVIFNPFRQRVAEELLPAAQAAGVGIIVRVPLASGVLSGKFQAAHAFAANDHRHFNADGQCFNVGETFAGVPFNKAVALAETIRQLLEGESPGASLARKVMRWILDHPAVSTIIPGAKSASQARDNAGAALLPPLSARAHEALRRLYQKDIHDAVRGRY